MAKKSKKQLVDSCMEIIESKFKQVDFNQRVELFKQLENWAQTSLEKDMCIIFLNALYNAPITQDIQISIAVEKTLNKGVKQDEAQRN